MALSDALLKFFADYILKETGIVYEAQNYYQLEQRLVKVSQMVGVASPQDLYDQARISISSLLKQCLLDTATNNETLFFRDAKVFTAIEKKILPELSKKFPKTLIYRIWCAASSFGQEPYSYAMLVNELMRANPGHPRFDIWATDISDTALAYAKKAQYSQLEVQRGMPALKLVEYFEKNDQDQWQLKPNIRSMVTFNKFNLLDNPAAFGLFHILSCRYVLIYQDHERKKEIINRLAKHIYPGGYLLMGASESALGLCNDLDLVNIDGAIFYQKK